MKTLLFNLSQEQLNAADVSAVARAMRISADSLVVHDLPILFEEEMDDNLMTSERALDAAQRTTTAVIASIAVRRALDCDADGKIKDVVVVAPDSPAMAMILGACFARKVAVGETRVWIVIRRANGVPFGLWKVEAM